MKQVNLKPQTIGICALAVFAVAGAGRFWLNERRGVTWRPDQHHIRMDVLSQEAASPGKVIRAISDGKVWAEYTCAREDAAVALVAVSDTKGSIDGWLTAPRAEDTSGQVYARLIYSSGNYFFVRILRGFPKTPDDVAVRADYYAYTNLVARPVARTTIHFKNFASPERRLSPPSGANLNSAESIAYAEYIEDRQTLHIKTLPNVSAKTTILATSFSGPDNARIRSQSRLQNLVSTYDSQADAVKVRVDFLRESESEISLTYRNAEIINLNGRRVLWLPTTQQVGTIDGCPAKILKYSDIVLNKMRPKHSHGNVYVRLGAQAPGFPPVRRGHLTCLGVSPSVEELGFDWITVGVDRFSYEGLNRSSSTSKSPPISTIPTLTFRFKLINDQMLESKTLVLPIHHVKQDPELIPKMPKTVAFLSQGPTY